MNEQALNRIQNFLRSDVGMITHDNLQEAGDMLKYLREHISDLKDDYEAICEERDEAFDRLDQIRSISEG